MNPEALAGCSSASADVLPGERAKPIRQLLDFFVNARFIFCSRAPVADFLRKQESDIELTRSLQLRKRFDRTLPAYLEQIPLGRFTHGLLGRRENMRVFALQLESPLVLADFFAKEVLGELGIALLNEIEDAPDADKRSELERCDGHEKIRRRRVKTCSNRL
ncbi:hypothetical protein F6X40_10255 [Paraburkholderia sp. UCT31]|uniref:hypothetical protein n=1 Tax=Paraburkholderia sp. UCT31 TaxID=2615209 RepID=UPI0016550C0B|nr:hypothetical protein [Paraburkholderia sp. UCT31]MBC8737190.1 hypothetical protein [Paraburkholderia sp. UCT31]